MRATIQSKLYLKVSLKVAKAGAGNALSWPKTVATILEMQIDNIHT